MTSKVITKSNPVLLFPGQGSQFVGMGKDLLKKSKSAKDVYEQVNESLGRDLTKIILYKYKTFVMKFDSKIWFYDPLTNNEIEWL